MRTACLAILCVLAGCAGGAPVAQTPGLDIARAALASGSPDIALRITQERLVTAPDDVSALLLQGEADTLLGDRLAAEAAFRRVLILRPGSVDARMGLGRLELVDGPTQAELLFLEVLAERPRDPVALNDLGIAQDLQGHHSQAQTSYRKALGISPNMQAPLVNLALSLALTGQAAEARSLLAPLARSGSASPRLQTDFNLVSQMAGQPPPADGLLAPSAPHPPPFIPATEAPVPLTSGEPAAAPDTAR
ncbi:MAG: tetratricopeptide repeat protein [Proteobacteria bacterium]|nr:tetratricopeptide repeat protein [Pseudomonadota bacterium]